nr:hypothetical protein [Dorea formicigenerans]
MSFVGTRPEAVKYVEKYKPEYMATLLLPAGITSEATPPSLDDSDYEKILEKALHVGYQKHNEEKAIEILDNVPKNFRDKQWYAVKRQLLENSIRKHSLAKRDILANEYTKELKKLDDVVEQKYGNINLREVDLLPDM